jgi:tetratricopeptide (TPR) repeat protein
MQQLIDSAMEQLSSEETAEQGYRLLEALAVARFDGEPRFLAGLAQTIAASPNVAVRNLDWALEKARRAVEITNSADANMLGVLAVTEFELGLNESAREHARRAIEVAGDDAGALNAIAWNMASNESIAGAAAPLALKAAKRAAEITERRDADILDTLARAQWEAGNHQQAMKTQQEAIETATNSRMKQRYQETLASFRERAAG